MDTGGGEEGEGEMYGGSDTETYHTKCTMGICRMTQGTQTGLCDRLKGGVGRELGGRPRRGGHGCTYGSFLLRYDRKPQTSVKRLSFN